MRRLGLYERTANARAYERKAIEEHQEKRNRIRATALWLILAVVACWWLGPKLFQFQADAIDEGLKVQDAIYEADMAEKTARRSEAYQKMMGRQGLK